MRFVPTGSGRRDDGSQIYLTNIGAAPATDQSIGTSAAEALSTKKLDEHCIALKAEHLGVIPACRISSRLGVSAPKKILRRNQSGGAYLKHKAIILLAGFLTGRAFGNQ